MVEREAEGPLRPSFDNWSLHKKYIVGEMVIILSSNLKVPSSSLGRCAILYGVFSVVACMSPCEGEGSGSIPG